LRYSRTLPPGSLIVQNIVLVKNMTKNVLVDVGVVELSLTIERRHDGNTE